MIPSADSLIPIVERFTRAIGASGGGAGAQKPRIMLIGDLMVDESIYGDAERPSPEAPVPVVQERYREQRAGGAGNVAAGLAALGGEVLCVSVIGNDFQGRL